MILDGRRPKPARKDHAERERMSPNPSVYMSDPALRIDWAKIRASCARKLEYIVKAAEIETDNEFTVALRHEKRRDDRADRGL